MRNIYYVAIIHYMCNFSTLIRSGYSCTFCNADKHLTHKMAVQKRHWQKEAGITVDSPEYFIGLCRSAVPEILYRTS